VEEHDVKVTLVVQDSIYLWKMTYFVFLVLKELHL